MALIPHQISEESRRGLRPSPTLTVGTCRQNMHPVRGPGTMKIKTSKAWIVIAALMVTLVVMFVVFSAHERQLQIKRVSQSKYPCIVLKVDNSGCQTEIEMRTHVAVAAN